MHSKKSSGKWRPYFHDFNMLTGPGVFHDEGFQLPVLPQCREQLKIYTYTCTLKWILHDRVNQGAWGRLKITMPSYQYRGSNVIFKMRIPIPGKDGLYIETGPWLFYRVAWGQFCGRTPSSTSSCWLVNWQLWPGAQWWWVGLVRSSELLKRGVG